MNDPSQPQILLIMGSVRKNRRCPQIASWVAGMLQESGLGLFEIIDLKEWSLPFDDEAAVPATGVYSQDHTRAWSEKVAAASGFVIVSPQYNWGYPASLKNALDHLFKEWQGKPVAIVTYGGHGGGKCAEQLKQVCEAMDMQPVQTMPAISIARALIETNKLQTIDDLDLFKPAVMQALSEFRDKLVALSQ